MKAWFMVMVLAAAPAFAVDGLPDAVGDSLFTSSWLLQENTRCAERADSLERIVRKYEPEPQIGMIVRDGKGYMDSLSAEALKIVWGDTSPRFPAITIRGSGTFGDALHIPGDSMYIWRTEMAGSLHSHRTRTLAILWSGAVLLAMFGFLKLKAVISTEN